MAQGRGLIQQGRWPGQAEKTLHTLRRDKGGVVTAQIFVELKWLYNIFSIPPDCRLRIGGEDVWVIRNFDGRGLFRLGYIGGFSFFRENPVVRALRRHGITAKEGDVGMNSEPQYDLIIHFNPNGEVQDIHDQRTGMEVDFKKKEE